MEYCICPKYIDENNAERENGSATNVTLSLPTKNQFIQDMRILNK